MTRKTQRALLNVGFFVTALLLILYLNREKSSDKAFAWTEIRYRTQANSLPEAHGVCPGLAESSKPALVVSRVAADGDPEWLDPLANKYHMCIYTADAPRNSNSDHLQVPQNRGHESMAYLTFIIDNYDNIPSAGVVFVHGSRWAWHNDDQQYDNAALLTDLNVAAALEPWGYHNLRCDWSASTCERSSAKAQGSYETSFRALLEPWNQRVISDAALPQAIASLFGNSGSASDDVSNGKAGQYSLERGDAVRSQCCAQFVVARNSILQHSKEEYIALRQWLLDGSKVDTLDKRPMSSKVAPPDDRIAGRILSYLWHILFVQRENIASAQSATGELDGINLEQLNTIACPKAAECYCRLYGRCDLQGCKEGRCQGQYRIPPGFKLPEDWAERHS